MKRLIIAFLIIAGIGGGVGYYYTHRGGGEIQVNTLVVSRGDIIDAVGSTGTLQAVLDADSNETNWPRGTVGKVRAPLKKFFDEAVATVGEIIDVEDLSTDVELEPDEPDGEIEG